MKIKKFNLFITSDINTPGRSISFSNIFIYLCLFSLSIILFFSFFGFYYIFIYDNITKEQLDFSQQSISNAIVKDSIYFDQNPVKETSGFDMPVISSLYKKKS